MRILGISTYYHDSAAALVEDGRIVAAAQEERFTRKKHDARFPEAAARYCLEAASCGLEAIDPIAFYEKPFLKFDRLLETYFALAPRGFASFRRAMPLWIKDKLFQKSMLRDTARKLPGGEHWNGSLLFTEHHQSHAASAFFPSPFQSAAVLTMDGVGEWCTTSIGRGAGNALEIMNEIHFPCSSTPLQCPGGADRRDARGCVWLLHGNRYRTARGRQLHAAQGRPECGAGRGL